MCVCEVVCVYIYIYIHLFMYSHIHIFISSYLHIYIYVQQYAFHIMYIDPGRFSRTSPAPSSSRGRLNQRFKCQISIAACSQYVKIPGTIYVADRSFSKCRQSTMP